MVCNESTSTCKYRQDDTSYCFYRGEADNPVLIILQEAGQAERELGRPATGRTGANLCRLFSKMRTHGCKNGSEYCIAKATVINAKTGGNCTIDKNPEYSDQMNLLRQKEIVFCFGEKAVRRFKTICKEYLPQCTKAFCFPHIGTLGLSWLKDGKVKTKPNAKKREVQMLRRMADFIENNLGSNKKFYAVEDFLKSCNLNWRTDLADWAMRKWLLKNGN